MNAAQTVVYLAQQVTEAIQQYGSALAEGTPIPGKNMVAFLDGSIIIFDENRIPAEYIANTEPM